MKRSSPVEPTLLFAGTLYHNKEFYVTVRERLKVLFGGIALESPDISYSHSDYYRDELGWPIVRKFLFFSNKIDPLALPDIKLLTNNIEEDLSTCGKRNINIDPGYMTLSKVVLASTKNYSHRIYIGKSIFAEVTLVHFKGEYQPHIFTYRDYAGRTIRSLFGEARQFLK